MKRTVCFLFVLASLTAVLCFSSCGECKHEWQAATCTKPKTCSVCGATEGEAPGHTYTTDEKPRTCTVCGYTDARLAVKVVIDGETVDTLYTDGDKNFLIQAPEKPEDITTNPHAEKYFYGWFIDSDFQTPLSETTEFRKDGAIYGKWMHVSTAGFTYTVSKGEATITGYSESAETTPIKTLVVPAYLDDFPVRYIGSKAFQGKTMLRTIILCPGITDIGNSAFAGCDSVTKIELPDSITNIGYSAFQGCACLTEITLSDNLQAVGNSAFADCTGLTNVIFANNFHFSSLGKSVFEGCSGLTGITIPSNVTSIGDSVFSGCSGLISITIPSSVLNIGEYAFSKCSKLEKVIFEDNSQCADIGKSAFQSCIGLTSITIPSSVTSIGNAAFSGCSGLKEVHISDIAAWCKISFNYAEANPLSYAHNLYLNDTLITKLIIPDNATGINGLAFYGCSGLTDIIIPNSVTSIGNWAFWGCSGLTNITIPSSVENIGVGTFSECANLKSVIFAENSQCSSIRSQAFEKCPRLTSITIPDSVTSIDWGIFYGCSGLTDITLPFTGASADDTKNTHFGYVFGAPNYSENSKYIPEGLKNVVISTTIGDYAFYGYSKLTSITIPSSVTSIGNNAFYDCTELKEVHISDIAAWCKISFKSNPLSYAHNLYLNGTLVTDLSIPNGVTSIGGAFSGCTELTSVTIPGSVTSIGDSAFV